jgi:hypothetical protein
MVKTASASINRSRLGTFKNWVGFLTCYTALVSLTHPSLSVSLLFHNYQPTYRGHFRVERRAVYSDARW